MQSTLPASSSGWVPIALSRDILTGSATDTAVHGSDIAVWRGTDGRVHAWDDRCPHRGMRLSLGFVREDRLVCLYHGWEYDSTGGCRRIPAHPDVTPPKSVRAQRYRVTERHGMVWADTGCGEEADSTPLVADQPATPACSVFLDQPASLVLDLLAAHTTAMRCTDHLIRATIDGAAVVMGLQVRDEGATALHLCLAEPADVMDLSRTILWAQGFRDRVNDRTVA